MKQGWIRIGLTFCMMLVMCMTAGNVACATVATTEVTTEVTAVDSGKVSGNVKKKIVKKNADFSVKTEMGLNGYATYGRVLPITLTVESKKNFEGEIRVIPGESDIAVKIAQGQDVVLAADESKKISFVMPSAGSNGLYYIQIANKDGKIIYSERDQLTLLDNGLYTKIGILSDDNSALNYFDGRSLKFSNYEGNTSILALDKEMFPENAEVLALLNYIVIDNYDTSQLSEKQYNALKEWVTDGGVLILGTGSNYQNVLHIFQDDFISGTFRKVDKKTLTWEESIVSGTDEQVQVQEAYSLEDVDCVDLSLEDGNVLEKFSSDGSAVYKDIGDGRVVVLAYDLAMEPFVSYRSRANVAVALLSASKTDKTIDNLNSNYYDNSAYSCYSIVKLTDSSRKPSGTLYGIILFGYVILVGPILYLILKLIKQREKIWIAIPVMALIFTGVVYGTSFLYRVNVPIVDTLSMISLSDDQQQEKVYTNIICPKTKNYELGMNADYQSIVYDTDNYGYGYSYVSSFVNTRSDAGQYDFMFKPGEDKNKLLFRNAEAFNTYSFSAQKSGENEIGTITYDLNCTTTGFSGTVTNHTHYDLEDAVVTFENHIYIAGDIKAGETIEIDPSRMKESVGYGTFDQLYSGASQNQKGYRNYQVDSMMENYYMKIAEYNQGIIWAKIDKYEPEQYICEGDVRSSGLGVVYMTFSEDYTDVKGTYYQSIDQMMMDYNGDYDRNDRSLYTNEMEVTYSFDGYEGITRLQNISKQNETQDRPLAQVFAYNYETGDYEEVFTDSDTISFDKYVVNDQLRLKYVQKGNNACYVPRICAKGDE